MTEIIIITLLVSAGIYLFRLARRAWCRLKGEEAPAHHHGPLPISRLVTYLRDMLSRVRRRLGGSDRENDAGAKSLETE